MKVFSIVDPVFKIEPLFIGNCEFSEMKEYMEKNYKIEVEDQSGVAGIMLTHDVAPHRVIWIKTMTRKPEGIGILAHEIFHLITRVCADKGIPIAAHHENGDNGDEAPAYLFEYFLKEALKKIKK